MKQGAQDSAGTPGAGIPRLPSADGAVRVPRQPQAAEVRRERNTPAAEARPERGTPVADVRRERGASGAEMRRDRGTSAADVRRDRDISVAGVQQEPNTPAAEARPERGTPVADGRRERDTPVGGGARGEHTHGERPVPPPRPVVRRSSVRGQILDALRTALVSGELRPGEVYSAPALGERFGVSATPVREAMQQLALEGAVEVVPNRGFRVVERDARELAELAEVRALVEVPVLLRLARIVPVERWAELRPLAEATLRAASSGCRATYAETDRAFHGAMLSLSGNEQLVRIAEDLHRRAQWPLLGGAGRPVRAGLVADAVQHTALLDALIARETETVRLLVREHFATVG